MEARRNKVIHEDLKATVGDVTSHDRRELQQHENTVQYMINQHGDRDLLDDTVVRYVPWYIGLNVDALWPYCTFYTIG